MRQDPAGLFELLREALGGAQAGLDARRQRRRLRHAGRPQPAGDRAAEAPAVRRRVLARARRAPARDRPPSTAAAAAARRARRPTTSRGRRCRSSSPAAIASRSRPKRSSSARASGTPSDRCADPAAAVHRLPEPVAGHRRVAAVRAVAGRRARRARVHAARRCRPRPPARPPCCSASASTASCCCTSRIVWRVAERRRALTCRAAIAGPSSSMLLGMWTTAATFYGLMFVDFPSLQQLGRLIGHSMVVCGVLTLVLVPALLPRRPPRRAGAALLMPRLAALDRPRRRGDPRRRASVADVRARVRRDRHAHQPDARAAAVGDRRRAARSDRSDRRSACRATSTSCSPRARSSSRCSRRTSGLRDASRRRAADLALQPPTRLLPSAAAQARTMARDPRSARLSPDTVRASLERARVASDFTPGAFEPFAARLPRLLDPAERLTYDGYVAHGLGDLHRSLRRPRRRPLDAGDLRVSVQRRADASRVQSDRRRVDPAQTLTGCTLVNRELARSFLPQFLKGLRSARSSSSRSSWRRSATGGCRCTRCCRPRSA